eukprot:2891540-Prymnesium_polylepis.1
MCLGSHRATIRREKCAAETESPRGGPGCASDVESASRIGPGVVRSITSTAVRILCGQGAVARGRPGERGATLTP